MGDEVLYHYCTNETLFAILAGKSIRLSALSYANDALEGRLLYQKLHQELALRGLSREWLDLIAVIGGGRPDHIECFAFCMSEQEDLLSQWRAYANDGTGMAIGFSKSSLSYPHARKNFGSNFFETIKVSYDLGAVQSTVQPIIDTLASFLMGKEPSIKLRDGVTIEQANSRIAGASNEQIGDVVGETAKEDLEHIINTIHKLAFRSYHFKSYGFHEEKEWRLARYRHKLHFDEVNYTPTDSAIKPYIDCSLDDAARESIVSITLGPKNQTDPLWLSAFIKSIGFPDISVRRSRVSGYR